MTDEHRIHRLRADALAAVQSGDELVALDLRRSLYLSTNASGRALWDKLAEGATVGQLAELLQERYGIDAATATEDATSFLSELAAHDLLADG
jgi:hypothetical protein